MMLPYCLDLLPTAIGKLCARLSGWQPVGKRVVLGFTEGPLYGTRVTGRIECAIPHILTAGPGGSTRTREIALLIRLDQPLVDGSRSVSGLVAVPRYSGHGPYRLPVTWCVVNVHASGATASEPPTVVQYEDMISICFMKLVRGAPGR